jgi:mono/diheme cytochrome c family protein
MKRQGVVKRALSVGAAVYCAASVIASAQTPPSPAGSLQQTPEADQALIDTGSIDTGLIDKGKVTYAEKCSHCHGFGMITAGTIAPDLRKFPHDEARFFTTVKLGKNNRMPPWGDLLSDDQIESLWAYVSSQRKP